jgi:hypothetical protein
MDAPLLSAQSKSLDDIFVAVGRSATQIVQMTPPLAYHLNQASAGMLIVFVLFQMVRQLRDSSRQQRDLYFWGARVVLSTTVLLNDRLFLALAQRHYVLLRSYPYPIDDYDSTTFRRSVKLVAAACLDGL